MSKEATKYLDASSPEPSMRIMHGFVRLERTDLVEQSWIERGDVTYDWQPFAREGEREALTREEFYERRAPIGVREYEPKEAVTALVLGGGLCAVPSWKD